MYNEKNESGLATSSRFLLRMRAGPRCRWHQFTFGDVIDVVTTASISHRIDADAARIERAVAQQRWPASVDPFGVLRAARRSRLYVESVNRWITRSVRKATSAGEIVAEGNRHSHLPVLPDRYSPRLAYDLARRTGTFHDLNSPDYEPVVEEFVLGLHDRRRRATSRRPARVFLRRSLRSSDAAC